MIMQCSYIYYEGATNNFFKLRGKWLSTIKLLQNDTLAL